MTVGGNKSTKISKHCFCKTSVICLKLLQGTHLPHPLLIQRQEWGLTATTNAPLPILPSFYSHILRVHMLFFHRIGLPLHFHQVLVMILFKESKLWIQATSYEDLPWSLWQNFYLYERNLRIKPISEYLMWICINAFRLISRKRLSSSHYELV